MGFMGKVIIGQFITSSADGDDEVVDVTCHIGVIGIVYGVSTNGISECNEQPIHGVFQVIAVV